MASILLKEIEDGVEVLTLNAPESRNALGAEMREALRGAVEEAAADSAVRVLILTGAGPAFCAGGDLKAMQAGQAPFEGKAKFGQIHGWERLLLRMEKPVIAAVNGPAVGGGLGLALACDFVLAAEDAVFSAPFGRLGLVPDYGLLYLLPRLVGMAKAREVLFTGRSVRAREFQEMGAVLTVTAPEDLMTAALDLGRKLSRTAPTSLGLTKRLLSASFESSLDQMLELEALTQALCYQSSDHKEGVDAFLGKRPPHYTGA